MTSTIKPEILDALLAGVSSPEELMGDAGLFRQLKKALMERALGGELTHHLGYEKHDPAGRGSGNSRNGHSSKTVLTGTASWTSPSRAIGPGPSSHSSCPRA
jgi:transposase-like protein